jgi:glutaminyl-peptide cyclotransferase
VVLATVVLALAFVLLAGCATRHSTAEQLHVQVLATFPHDTTMFTEGLEIHDGVLYESSGLVGQSRIRATALSNGTMLREATLPAPLFGEGITIAGARLWQLTWTNGVAIERDPASELPG